jgi:hypothetical protein
MWFTVHTFPFCYMICLVYKLARERTIKGIYQWNQTIVSLVGYPMIPRKIKFGEGNA